MHSKRYIKIDYGPKMCWYPQIGKLCWYPHSNKLCWYPQIGKLCWYLQIGKLCWYPQIGKLCWYPHANKLLQKFAIFNKAINTHSRGLTEQHSYVWEPHHGCLHKVKKVCWYPQIGKLCWSPHANKLLQKFAIFNKAINTHSRGLTEQHSYVWEPHRGCLHKVKKVC